MSLDMTQRRVNIGKCAGCGNDLILTAEPIHVYLDDRNGDEGVRTLITETCSSVRCRHPESIFHTSVSCFEPLFTRFERGEIDVKELDQELKLCR